MIPARRRAILPPGHWWIAHRRHGRLTVTLAACVPIDSELEHELVRQAVRAWKHHERRGLVLLPAPIAAGGGLPWLIEQFRRPAVAAGTAVAAAGVAFGAVAVVEMPAHKPHRPPAAAASPRSGGPPLTRPAPGAPSVKPRPDTPTPGTSTDAPDTGPGSGSDAVPAAVKTVRRTLPGPVRRIVPPRVKPSMPVEVPPPVVSAPPRRCRLVQVEVGKLLRVCL